MSILSSLCIQCLSVGFDAASLCAGGFSDYEIVRSKLFSNAQLRHIGCDTQRIALMALFEATDGRHWRHRDNWGSATLSVSHWYGVHVDGGGAIVKIDLRSNCLLGNNDIIIII